jgi:hypothetical protein
MRMETMSAEEKAKLPSSVLEGIGSARTYLPLSRAVLDGTLVQSVSRDSVGCRPRARSKADGTREA